MIDVGHTPDGIRQSLASLKAIHGGEDWILVTGASGDKKANEIVGALAPAFDTIIARRPIIRAPGRRTSPPQHGAPIRRRRFMSLIRSRMRCVWRSELAAAQQRKIYVAGGLFLAIEYATAAKGGRAQDLGFF